MSRPVNVCFHDPAALSSCVCRALLLPSFLSSTFAEALAGPTHAFVTDTFTFSLFVFVIVNPFSTDPVTTDVYPCGIFFSFTVYLISVPFGSYLRRFVNLCVQFSPGLRSYVCNALFSPSFLSSTVAESLAGPTHALVTVTSTVSSTLVIVFEAVLSVSLKSDSSTIVGSVNFLYPWGAVTSTSLYLSLTKFPSSPFPSGPVVIVPASISLRSRTTLNFAPARGPPFSLVLFTLILYTYPALEPPAPRIL